MKVSLKNEFDYSMDAVLDATHFNMVRNFENYKEVLDLKDVKRTHFKELPDGRQEVEFTVCAHKQIPKPAQIILKPDMLTWRQVGKWDPRSKTYSYEIIPFFFRNFFYCKGTCVYREENGRVAQVIEYSLNVKIPVVGGLIEQTIAREFRKSQTSLNAKQRELLAREQGAKKPE